MSRRQTLEQLYDLYNRAAFEGVSAIPEEFVFHPPEQTLHPEPVVGRDAFRKFLEPDLFTEQWVEVQEITEKDEFAFVSMRAGGVTVSGARLEQPSFQVWRFDGEVPCEAWVFTDRDDAERQAGLRN